MKTSQETVLKTLRVLFKKTVSKLEVEKFLKYKKLFSFFKIFLKHRNTSFFRGGRGDGRGGPFPEL